MNSNPIIRRTAAAKQAVAAHELNRLAIRSGVTVLGAGVNPGFVMDLLPLLLHHRRILGRLSVPLASVLVLIGGFVLRAVVVLSSEGIARVAGL